MPSAPSSSSNTPSVYAHVVRGGLKLKEYLPAQKTGGAKQQRKKKRSMSLQDVPAASLGNSLSTKETAAADAEKDAQESSIDNSKQNTTKHIKLLSLEENEKMLLKDVMVPDEALTSAEKAFRLAQKKRETGRTNKRLALTHRQRMERFNAQLMTLPERKFYLDVMFFLSGYKVAF